MEIEGKLLELERRIQQLKKVEMPTVINEAIYEARENLAEASNGIKSYKQIQKETASEIAETIKEARAMGDYEAVADLTKVLIDLWSGR